MYNLILQFQINYLRRKIVILYLFFKNKFSKLNKKIFKNTLTLLKKIFLYHSNSVFQHYILMKKFKCLKFKLFLFKFSLFLNTLFR